MKKTFRSGMAAVACLTLGLLAACSRSGGGGVNVGDVIPNFTLQTLDGQPFNMADHKGKVVLINIFGTW